MKVSKDVKNELERQLNDINFELENSELTDEDIMYLKGKGRGILSTCNLLGVIIDEWN